MEIRGPPTTFDNKFKWYFGKAQEILNGTTMTNTGQIKTFINEYSISSTSVDDINFILHVY